MHEPTKSALSIPRKTLLELMQRINFGVIEKLAIRGGEPILNPPPRIVRDVKFCSEGDSRPESHLSDFILKAQVLELFRVFDRRRNGTIHCLEIKHGLPFRMQIEEEVE